MVMLQKELGTDKEIYILDEPERSLGNEYINPTLPIWTYLRPSRAGFCYRK